MDYKITYKFVYLRRHRGRQLYALLLHHHYHHNLSLHL